MRLPNPTTVREQMYWSYANLGRADAALQHKVMKYQAVHHMIRSKLYSGLMSGNMTMRTMYDDERLKMSVPHGCSYCGSQTNLSVDHLIPRLKGGSDEADNLISACRTCNSSKGAKDMLEWMASNARFPALLLLRRYMKLVSRHCENVNCLESDLRELPALRLPFDLMLLPIVFPPLNELIRWVHPRE